MTSEARIQTPGTTQECSLCGKKFKTKQKLKQHSVVHEDERPFHCDICGMNFKRNDALKVHHKRQHTGPKSHQCPQCPKSYSIPSDLKRHARIHNGEGLLECSVCNRKVGSASTLKVHMIQHTGTSDHMCPFCSFPAPSQSALEIHLTSHTKEKPFQCNLCPSAFGLKQNLTSHHKRNHNTEGRKHNCQFCDYAGKEKSDLRKHLVSHRNEREFKCPFCDRGFNYSKSLKTHIMTHTREKPYQCHICHRAFATLATCKQHVATEHDGIRVKCDVCGKEFRSRASLNVHVARHRNHHENCQFCLGQRCFPRLCDLNFHRRIHKGRNGRAWECGPCNVSFGSKTALGSHQNQAKCQEKRKAEMLGRQLEIILERI